MGHLLTLLDSKLLHRLGGLISLLTIGALLVGVLRVQGADLASGASSVVLLCFGAWTALAVLLIVSWQARRHPAVLASPAAHLAISKGVPGSSRALYAALARAEETGREFIAEAAILFPINNQRAAFELAHAYTTFEAEVASLIGGAEQFDERWSLTWARRPSSFSDHLLDGPFTLGTLGELVRYMSHRNRQIGWMLDFLAGGSDEHVRHAHAWARADERAAREARAA